MFAGIWAAFWFALNNFFIEDKLALLHTNIVTLSGCKNGVGGKHLHFLNQAQDKLADCVLNLLKLSQSDAPGQVPSTIIQWLFKD